MDRTIVTGMVEDYWRTAISAMQTGGMNLFFETGQRFEQRVAETADLMEPLERAAFLQTIEAERELLVTEYQADPALQKMRLGIAMGIDAPRSPQQRNGFGDLVVRTAVRATIWESIWALFRAVR